jgi:hypothetical protein
MKGIGAEQADAFLDAVARLESEMGRPLSTVSAEPDERAAAALRNTILESCQTISKATADCLNLASKLAAERHERETDPLTKLPAPLLPSAPTDIVVIGCGPATVFFEFRRADGQRYQCTTQGPIACIPAADWALESWGSDWIDTKRTLIALRSMVVTTAEAFDDVQALVTHAYQNQRWPADFRAGGAEQLLETLIAMPEERLVPVLARWFKAATGDVRETIIGSMRKLHQLAVIGMEDPVENSWSLAPPFRKEVPHLSAGPAPLVVRAR